jgi:adenylate cyclase
MLANADSVRQDCAMDFAAAGLLDGLEGEAREARERLLAQLIEDGVGLDELKAAAADERLTLLAVDRLLEGRYTAREIEHRAGLPSALVLRIRRVSGLPEAGPEDRVFAEEDVRASESLKLFLDAGMDEQRVIEIARVLGEGLSRAAATITFAFGDSFIEPGDSEDEAGRRFAALAKTLLPALTPVLASSFRAHLRESVQRARLERAWLERGHIEDAAEMTVCFADLVGFTRLGGEIEVQQLGDVASTLAELANEVATGPVRLLKTIGDAAMFVSTEPAPLVEAAVSLLDAGQKAELPSLRAGIAKGATLVRAGDFYGHAVNLASRVTGIARPDSVLCTKEVRDLSRDGFDWSFAGRYRLKGLADAVPLYRARHLGSSEHPEEPEPSPPHGQQHDPEAAKRRRADRRRKRAAR